VYTRSTHGTQNHTLGALNTAKKELLQVTEQWYLSKLARDLVQAAMDMITYERFTVLKEEYDQQKEWYRPAVVTGLVLPPRVPPVAPFEPTV
jgi:hypothetical protein